MKSIDINCDMGESYGNFKIGNDLELMPFISSCNVACGFHGGDPLTIENTILRAKEFGLAIGAHPSYPDLSGFGRRKMIIDSEELKAIVKYQISALAGMCNSLGAKLKHVKPHGALYNAAASDRNIAWTIGKAMLELDSSLILVGLYGSQMQEIAEELNIKFISEAFIDRAYDKGGKLLSRNVSGAVHTNPEIAAKQALEIVLNGKVDIQDKEVIQIECDTLCIHGDNPAAKEILIHVKESFQNNDVNVRPFSHA
ncbi:LamB/YcsF family protein [Marinigracilibium pacificum]|uniref:LamB/YcsF family protein n=1 Tax=Marinigracilibium pacificum TaxID=2729599 RepID=A0A848IY90_9BACT|nr:5-oxoprolinase subunit PxpA [Marinigracilibium pacificum]NMM47214.1 LamB/YcsF family protein [Marinigracilibium pacificum]